MTDLYFKPDEPGSFGGITKFKTQHPKSNVKEIIKEPAYYLHFPVVRKFKRRKTEVNGINEQWQIDLLDIRKYKTQNSHFTFLLTCIDVFSKYAWVVPIKQKRADMCRDAFKKIFKEAKPLYIYSDKGREFMGECNALFKQLGIVHLSTQSINKAAVVERFNRTLKEKIWRYLSRDPNSKSKKFINVLPDLVKSYNKTIHKEIKTSPDQVGESNQDEIRKILFGENINFVDLSKMNDPSVITENTIDLKFGIGEYVRKVDDDDIKIEKTRYNRGHLEKWTKNLFVVQQVLLTRPPTYVLFDVDKQKTIDRKYYKEELQKAHDITTDAFQYLKKSKDKYLICKVNSSTQEKLLVDEKFLKDNNVHYNKK